MSTFRLAPDQIEEAWTTMIEVVFAPKTGSIKPWELWGVFIFPHSMRQHWASFKTEAAANKSAAKTLATLQKKYPQVTMRAP